MKTISVRQPWAWLIINGYKDIENRSREANYRGPVLIHASAHRPTQTEIQEARLILEKTHGAVAALRLPRSAEHCHLGGLPAWRPSQELAITAPPPGSRDPLAGRLRMHSSSPSGLSGEDCHFSRPDIVNTSFSDSPFQTITLIRLNPNRSQLLPQSGMRSSKLTAEQRDLRIM